MRSGVGEGRLFKSMMWSYDTVRQIEQRYLTVSAVKVWGCFTETSHRQSEVKIKADSSDPECLLETSLISGSQSNVAY